MLENKILLFDNFDINSQKLYNSLKKSNFNGETYVINDNNFLPSEIKSFYQVICDLKKEGKPKYFNEIPVPDYWEIKGNNQIAHVYDRDSLRANILYSNTSFDRFVKKVEWLDKKMKIRLTDHYDRYGNLYAKTTFNKDSKPIVKTYFDSAGRERIVENFVTKNILVNIDNKDYIFNDKIDFVLFMLKREKHNDSDIIINSLSTPFFVSLRFNRENAKDVLFWQEDCREDIPGNMKFIFDNHSNINKIFVQQKNSYEKFIELGAPKSKLLIKGYVYDYKRISRYSKNILICTNSDQLLKIKELITELKGFTFHIAALTEMSSKLLSLSDFENVKLYPTSTISKINDLFNRCDIYLDINKGIEILSSVENAFLYNHLIFSFKEINHSPNYVVPQNVFPCESYSDMVKKINDVTSDIEDWKKEINNQKNFALSENSDKYLLDL